MPIDRRAPSTPAARHRPGDGVPLSGATGFVGAAVLRTYELATAA